MNDLIDRQKVIDALCKSECGWNNAECRHKDGTDFCVTCDNVKIIKSLPSVQPERKTGRWIPVSERLPDDLAEVNVTWINHEPEPYYDFVKDKPFTASAVYYKGDWYWYSSVCVDILAEYGKNEIDKLDDAIEITAWKPLPEPYQEGEQE